MGSNGRRLRERWRGKAAHGAASSMPEPRAARDLRADCLGRLAMWGSGADEKLGRYRYEASGGLKFFLSGAILLD